jgi:hypothetical protein
MSTNQTAQDAYTAAHSECARLLAIVSDHIQNAEPPNEATHWGNVGDMTRLAEKLRDIVDHECWPR